MNKKTQITILLTIFVLLSGVTYFATRSSEPAPLKIGAQVVAQGFLDKPATDVITANAPTSLSCSMGGTGGFSSVDGTTRIAKLTWNITPGTNGLIRSPSGWFGYVPMVTNSTASEAFSVPITGATQFIITESNGKATTTCSVTVS